MNTNRSSWMVGMIRMLVFSLAMAGCTAAATPAPPPVEIPVTEALLPSPPPATSTPQPPPLPTPTLQPPLACMISFDSDRDGNLEVYVMGPDGKDPVNLTNNPGEDSYPVWSPDGSQIAFVSNRENGEKGGQFIYVMHADGSHVRQLTRENESKWPDWSHDGRFITYTHKDDIYIIPADGSGPSRNLTNSPEKEEQPTWSPDGSKIAWLADNNGNWNIFVMDTADGHVKQITDNGRASRVLWTVDNQIFTGWGWKDQPEFCQNCVVDADGSNITDAGGKGEMQRYLPFWTVDGQRVEVVNFSNFTGDDEIYLVGEIFPDVFLNLTNHPAQDRHPDWPANCGPERKAAAPLVQPAPDSGGIVIGYAGDDQWQPQRKQNFQQACDELGILCVYGEMPQLIEQGVDAIVQNTNPIVVKGLHPDILNARDQGIPVLLLDAETITDGAYSITIDQHAWAKTSLEWMFQKMDGSGEFAYFDLHPFYRHTDTIQKILNSYPGIQVVEYRDGKYDPEKIKPETIDFVKAHPQLQAIWSNAKMTDMLIAMEEELNLPPGQWPSLICDATLDSLSWWEKIRKADPAFECIAVVNPPGIAYDAVYAAYFLINGSQINPSVLQGEFGHSLYVDMPVITNENLQEWLEKGRAENMEFLDERMTPEQIKEAWFLE